ncbi:uncharacterized protein LOC123880901 [Maniola jurtina]|uniref:uncharacterized protein LOC123880901 n=1 Tax=Maniola jurtina TaxID=191418 RepID=UPI001E68C53D|nr:uncharacterized protein LOC123880901 [Maniola jurtina]
MEPGSTNKQRTPSRCREWERQRRIKFNDAISKLGEIVKSINRANNDEEADNVQYPKIEIVQKAILCLTNCLKEKTQLKADILALEIKLETIEKHKNNKKDVSIQVTLGITKKSPHCKCVKIINQSTKTDNAKETTTTNPKQTGKKTKVINRCPPKLPKLLPISNLKKEGTIVMLPATPYIFPQRPVLFPQAPTIVLVDTNLQPLNKQTTIPIINRNSNDITKTTMVNVLPISAYSHPLSAKTKKSNSKPRNNTIKKSVKRPKLNGSNDKKEENADKEKPNEELSNKNDDINSNDKKVEPAEKVIETIKGTVVDDKSKSPELDKFAITDDKSKNPELNKLAIINETITSTNKINIKPKNDSNVILDNTLNNLTGSPKCSGPSIIKSNNGAIIATLPNCTAGTEKITNTVTIQEVNTKCTKIPPDKNIVESEYKNKENKMQTIMDTTVCENVVDAGNARLELAEELLAASPTAAFLMSFPLVSGNRADSPAEETANTTIVKESSRRNETPAQQISYFDKSNLELKNKTSSKSQNTTTTTTTTTSNTLVDKTIEQLKYENNKSMNFKPSVPATVTNENPFLNLPLPSIVPSSCTLTDSTFGLDFDCNVTKTVTSQPTTYSTTNNIFYKSDPFNTVKSTIYSTSSISSGHEFNSLGLYPCAMDNYSSKNKSDYSNVEDNLMKINSSRLTYDIDLGWSHKSFDFVNCTTGANTFHKDNILTTAATPFSTAYNPFNPEFHVPLVSNSNKKNPASKTSTFPEQITSLYSQSTNLWPEDVSSIYTNSNVSRNFIPKQQNFFPPENLHPNINAKTSVTKQFDNKNITENTPNIVKSSPIVDQHIVEKYTKKSSPNKMHINWMTSEIRPMQNNCNQNHINLKEPVKIPYSQIDQVAKKLPQSDSCYFPINMHNFPTQSNHEELQVWPTARPAGTTEISIEPPPINLPTLVGDLALGPHDKKKSEIGNRILPHTELQTCGNFLSVTQLMNRSSDNIMPSRSNGPMNESQKSKQNLSHVLNESNRKTMPARLETHPQICYGFNDSKVSQPYENINQFSQAKSKSNNKPDKIAKAQKNNYSAEALIRGGTTCSQKLLDNNNTKFMGASQKYNDFNVAHDSGVAQVSHFPPILDYSDNTYAGQQFSGTTLYNSTTNTISNSFYSNFMPGSSNLMAGNYAGGSFSSEFVDYNQVAECNYSNQKFNEIKMKNNASTFQQDKEQSNYKSSRRESAPKHKLECSKKESSKKYQNKRTKLANEVEEWNESNLLWQNKPPVKRHQNLMSEELPFTNYVGNQMPAQYQPDFINSHIMQSNIQNAGPNTDRSLSSFPVASRANFNLSALFPEITMKVQ